MPPTHSHVCGPKTMTLTNLSKEPSLSYRSYVITSVAFNAIPGFDLQVDLGRRSQLLFRFFECDRFSLCEVHHAVLRLCLCAGSHFGKGQDRTRATFTATKKRNAQQGHTNFNCKNNTCQDWSRSAVWCQAGTELLSPRKKTDPLNSSIPAPNLPKLPSLSSHGPQARHQRDLASAPAEPRKARNTLLKHPQALKRKIVFFFFF